MPDPAILIALIDLEREMARLSVFYGASHPRMLSLDARAAALVSQLDGAPAGSADNAEAVRDHVAAALVDASVRLADIDTRFGPEHPDRAAAARDRDYVAELSAVLATR
jgi:hypothetical protein